MTEALTTDKKTNWNVGEYGELLEILWAISKLKKDGEKIEFGNNLEVSFDNNSLIVLQDGVFIKSLLPEAVVRLADIVQSVILNTKKKGGVLPSNAAYDVADAFGVSKGSLKSPSGYGYDYVRIDADGQRHPCQIKFMAKASMACLGNDSVVLFPIDLSCGVTLKKDSKGKKMIDAHGRRLLVSSNSVDFEHPSFHSETFISCMDSIIRNFKKMQIMMAKRRVLGSEFIHVRTFPYEDKILCLDFFKATISGFAKKHYQDFVMDDNASLIVLSKENQSIKRTVHKVTDDDESLLAALDDYFVSGSSRVDDYRVQYIDEKPYLRVSAKLRA